MAQLAGGKMWGDWVVDLGRYPTLGKKLLELGSLFVPDNEQMPDGICPAWYSLELGIGFGEIEKGDLQRCAHGSDLTPDHFRKVHL